MGALLYHGCSRSEYRSLVVGPIAGTSSHLRVGVDTASVSIASAVQNCADCEVTIDGTTGGEFTARSNSNLILGPITLGGEVGTLVLDGNTFASFGGITGGDVVILARLPDSSGNVIINNNAHLSLSAIGIGNIAHDLTIRQNHSFTDADALAFVRARTVGHTVDVVGNVVE
jgi:hypothetical protein